MKKQYLLIPLGFALIVVGGYIMSEPLQKVVPRQLSWMEEQNVLLLSTDYPIGVGLASVGVSLIISVIVWKHKSSQRKT